LIRLCLTPAGLTCGQSVSLRANGHDLVAISEGRRESFPADPQRKQRFENQIQRHRRVARFHLGEPGLAGVQLGRKRLLRQFPLLTRGLKQPACSQPGLNELHLRIGELKEILNGALNPLTLYFFAF
jgi:hypothetical protein